MSAQGGRCGVCLCSVGALDDACPSCGAPNVYRLEPVAKDLGVDADRCTEALAAMRNVLCAGRPADAGGVNAIVRDAAFVTVELIVELARARGQDDIAQFAATIAAMAVTRSRETAP